MSRSKRNKRSSARTRRREASAGIDSSKLDKLIAELTHHAFQNGRGLPALGAFDSRNSPFRDDFDDDDVEEEEVSHHSLVAPGDVECDEDKRAPLEEWKEAIRDIFYQLRHRIPTPILPVEKIHFACVGEREYCIGNVQEGNSTFTANIVLSQHSATCWTNCNCKDKLQCRHAMSLLKFVNDTFTDDNSDLIQQWFPNGYRKQRLQKSLQVLRRLTSGNSLNPTGSYLVDQTEAEVAVRFLWDLELTSGSRDIVPDLRVFPNKQAELKRGDWGKPRRISPSTFWNTPVETLSDFDTRMRDACRRSEAYGNDITINVLNALEILQGTDRVTFDGRPVSVTFKALELTTKEVGEHIEVHCSLEDYFQREGAATDIVSARFPGGIAVIDLENESVDVFKCPANSATTLIETAQSPLVFDKEDRDQLLAGLQAVSGDIPVRLSDAPEEELISEGNEVALLLQMRCDGELNVSVCVKDHDQRLLIPGKGPVSRTGLVDERPVRLIRDLAEEQKRAAALTRRLHLPAPSFANNHVIRVAGLERVTDLMADVGELVQQGEVAVIWHKQSASQFNVLGALTAANVRIQIERQRDWFGVNGSCTIGNQEIPLKEVLAGMRGRRMSGLLEITPGQWASVSAELQAVLNRLADVSQESRGKLSIDRSSAMSVAALRDLHVQVESNRAWEKCLKNVENAQHIDPPLPEGLQCQLRDYQRDGFRWLCRLAEWGVGGILADDMGLGKTVQALAVLLHRIQTGPALVVAPTSLGFNWEAESARFAPALNPIQLREADRSEVLENAKAGDLIICSYALALREEERLSNVKWGTVIFDEAQNIKNSNSKTARSVRALPAEWTLALTGTPMENHLGELWSIFRAIAPGVLGSWEQFRKRFALPIEKYNDSERREALSQVISPFVLRRSKAEVLRELPARSEMNILVDLSPDERREYDKMRMVALGQLEELEGEDSGFSSDQRFRILQMLTRLRQLACHVGLVDDSWNGSSSKFDMLMERLQQLKERGHRPLIFSQFTSHLDLIRKACDAGGFSYLYLDGQTPPKQRQQNVEAFQNGEGDVFLISLKAGGTGLNLTAADYVIHMDPWWNPAVEDQATDRAHRIGQTNTVMVYRFIARGTIEEEILKLHADKRDLVDGILSGTEASAKMSTEELANLIRWGNQSAS
ncbi:MAG: DEAD/DEAH box helicase [Planctomycetaceae bacterium]|nr:DEAD/DEAH box helicase [Planctomycetaceae bacterium]